LNIINKSVNHLQIFSIFLRQEQVKQLEQRLWSGQETLRKEALKREQHLAELQAGLGPVRKGERLGNGMKTWDNHIQSWDNHGNFHGIIMGYGDESVMKFMVRYGDVF
jgi:Trp operon repressor